MSSRGREQLGGLLGDARPGRPIGVISGPDPGPGTALHQDRVTPKDELRHGFRGKPHAEFLWFDLAGNADQHGLAHNP